MKAKELGGMSLMEGQKSFLIMKILNFNYEDNFRGALKSLRAFESRMSFQIKDELLNQEWVLNQE